MSRMKIFLSLVVIVLAVTLVGGATLAWFTAETDPLENVFTAGTVEIEAGGKSRVPNWNPGDIDEAKFCVTNTGSKKVNVRLNLTEAAWNPGPLRILVLYTRNNQGAALQLVGVEWASFCQGCTGEEGHLATVTSQYLYSSSQHPDGLGLVLNRDSYFGVNFSNIVAGSDRDQDDVEKWLSSNDNTNPFTGWCLDNVTNISAGTYNDVRVYDPFCNPGWYSDLQEDGLPVKAQWQNIDFDKIAYIINHGFLNRGYNSTEVQQAIWQYTNGSYLSRYYLGDAAEINDFVNGIAGGPDGDILAALNAVDNVKWNVISWEIKEGETVVTYGNDSTDWVEDGNIIYFVASQLEPGQTLCLVVEVKLIGSLTGNIYQGVDYVFKGFFEAVQSSNFAPYYEWNVNYYGTP